MEMMMLRRERASKQELETGEKGKGTRRREGNGVGGREGILEMSGWGRWEEESRG